MKKILPIVSIIPTIFFISMNANAEKESTISLGYAQSNAKVDLGGVNVDLDDTAHGFNIKYRYDLDNNWGVISSFTYTHKGYENNTFKIKGDVDYYSFDVGPAYRFNEQFSVYGLLGVGHGKADIRTPEISENDSETALAYGLGIQVNPIKNIVIDASYEYSKLSDIKVGTWMLGVGFKF